MSLLEEYAQEEGDLIEDSFEEFGNEEESELKALSLKLCIQMELVEFKSILVLIITYLFLINN